MANITSQSTGSGDYLQWIEYKYTPAGDIRQKIDNVRGNTYTYTYDKLHRLVEELAEGYLPPLANTTFDYGYDEAYQPHAVKQIALNGSEPYDYSYDENGNMVAGPDFTNPSRVVGRTIMYNADNMPLGIVHDGAVSTEFVYDGAGRRAKKMVAGGAATYYIGDHYEVKNGVATKYIFAGSRRIAKRTGNQIYYYHKDHLGSSTVMEARLGGTVESTDYLPFGSQREQSGTSVTDYKYTDQELDASTGLYNYDARLYDPVVGRFITADSIVPDWYDPQSLNRYAYALSNPLKYVDPSGHNVVVLEALQGAKGAGHTGMLVQRRNILTGNTIGWAYYSRNGENKGSLGSPNPKQPLFSSPEDFLKKQSEAVKKTSQLELTKSKRTLTSQEQKELDYASEFSYFDEKTKKATLRYDVGYEISTDIGQDAAIDSYAKKHQNDAYGIVGTGTNCKDLVRNSLARGGIVSDNATQPNDWYRNLTGSHSGKHHLAK